MFIKDVQIQSRVKGVEKEAVARIRSAFYFYFKLNYLHQK